MATSLDLARSISDRCTCLRLRSAARSMTRQYDHELRELDLRLTQLTVLVGVAMFGDSGAPVSALADAVGMERTTLTRNLKPLAARRWLSSSADRGDLRSRRITLTKKGELLLAKAYPLWQRAQASTERALGEHNRTLSRVLDEVLGTRSSRADTGDSATL
ncbi:MAG: MarR family transcriptional regulator [Kofleriaceae bacterium]